MQQEAEPEVIVKVFYCYAREDKALRDELDGHLSPLKRSRLITTWCDREIAAGSEWEQEIHTRLEDANLILLLVSSTFIASDYCWGKEMHQALERQKAGKARVIPLILRPVLWKETPLGALQALPIGAKPVTQWADRDLAFEHIAREINEIVKTLIEQLKVEEQHRQLGTSIMKLRQSLLDNLQRALQSKLVFYKQLEEQMLVTKQGIDSLNGQIEDIKKTFVEIEQNQQHRMMEVAV